MGILLFNNNNTNNNVFLLLLSFLCVTQNNCITTGLQAEKKDFTIGDKKCD